MAGEGQVIPLTWETGLCVFGIWMTGLIVGYLWGFVRCWRQTYE